MRTETVSIPLAEAGPVSARLDLPVDTSVGTGVVLAHGAGNDMDNPLLAHVAAGLARSGVGVLRFNFPYREEGRRRPDPEPRLEVAWSGAVDYLRRRTGCPRLVAAGKSLGGRIASQMTAGGRLDPDLLVFYGYPLHAPGKKDRPRDAHLYDIAVPMLFFAGTRDALCDLAVLRPVLGRIAVPNRLVTVEGGDHSFQLPASAGTPPESVFDTLATETVEFLDAHLGAGRG
jgi:predicted alpha/beta-hydrolase family hydrolase